MIAVDVIAKENGYYIENFKDLKKVNAAIVNGEKVAFVGDKFPKLQETDSIIKVHGIKDAHHVSACVLIKDGSYDVPDIPYVVFRKILF